MNPVQRALSYVRGLAALDPVVAAVVLGMVTLTVILGVAVYIDC